MWVDLVMYLPTFCFIFCFRSRSYTPPHEYIFFPQESDSLVLYICIQHIHTYMYIYMLYTYIHTYIYICMYVSIYICPHVNIHYTYSTILSLGGVQKWRVFTIRWKHGAQGSEKWWSRLGRLLLRLEKIRSRNKRKRREEKKERKEKNKKTRRKTKGRRRRGRRWRW